jgi:hypothetical protein
VFKLRSSASGHVCMCCKFINVTVQFKWSRLPLIVIFTFKTGESTRNSSCGYLPQKNVGHPCIKRKLTNVILRYVFVRFSRRHGKLFVDRPCKKRADDLLKLGRHQLKMAVAILTGHAPVRGHLQTMGLFSGDPSCRFCRMETETVQHITCCCEALARQRYNIFGKPFSSQKK